MFLHFIFVHGERRRCLVNKDLVALAEHLVALIKHLVTLIPICRYDHGVIEQIQKHKLIFIETQDSAETSLALLNYIKAERPHLGVLLTDLFYRIYRETGNKNV